MLLIALFIWLKSDYFIFFCDQDFSGGFELFKVVTNPESTYVPWWGVIALKWNEEM